MQCTIFVVRLMKFLPAAAPAIDEGRSISLFQITAKTHFYTGRGVANRP